VLPPQQRLAAGDASGLEIEDGLVVENSLFSSAERKSTSSERRRFMRAFISGS
jgi:hypothetical protein